MTIRLVPTNFATIQAAVNASIAGDQIVVEAAYANVSENVSVTVDNLTFDGSAGTGVVQFTLAAGIAGITLTGAANFRVAGNASDNTISGNDGANILAGNEGNDTISGGAGNDTITGDSISAGAGNDILRGDGGDDTITDNFGTVADIDGGSGNDTVTIAATFTSGTVAGGADNDTLAVGAASNLSLLSVTGFENLQTVGNTVTATVAQFEAFDRIFYNGVNPNANVALQLAASGGPVTLDLADELIAGGTRGAILTGAGDAETLTTGNGNDTINGGGANDTLNGGDGNDTLNGDAGDDVLNGQNDNDILNGSEGNDQIFGGLGNDTITGDNISAGAGNDILRGENGDDTITDNFGTVADINSGIGNDTVNIAATFTSGTLAGGADVDTLFMNGAANLSLLTISGFERLLTNGNVITATAAQFEAFDRIAFNAANPTVGVSLQLAATGGATTLDLAGELADGGPRNVTVTGTSDAETITTGDLSDTIHGGGGDDNLSGGLGNDFLNGNEGSDTISGGDGNDTITGDSVGANAGNDILRGDAGDDTITDAFGTVADIDGGAGNDTVNINTNFLSGAIAGGADIDTLFTNGAVNLTTLGLSGLERLLTNGNVVTATAAQFEAFDRIAFNAANPTVGVSLQLAATGGATTLDLAGELADGGPRNVTVTGTSDAETITTGDLSDTIHGGGGNDILNGGLGDDTLNGNEGDDQIFGGSGNDAITGDSVSTNAGNDILRGDAGDDTITDAFGTVADIDGGAGNDTVNINTNFLSGAIAGGADIDTLFTNGAVNLTTLGLSGFERLLTNGNVVTATAAQFEAFDRIAFNAFNPTVSVNLQIAATGGATVLDLAGELADGGLRAATVTGSTDAETITTGDGSDSISAGLGNDVLTGGLGDDFLNGEGGVDTASYATASGAVQVDLRNTSTFQNTGSAGSDRLTSIENLVGSAFNDTLTSDLLSVNELRGGAGNDVYNIFQFGDLPLESAGEGSADLVNAFSNVALTATSEIETIIAQLATGMTLSGSDTANRIEGNIGNDNLSGNGDADTLLGFNGNDILDGGSGNDILDGGAGNDTLNGGADIDTATYASAASAVNVDLALTSAQNTLAAGFDTLSNIESLIGSAFDDLLTGNHVDNRLEGGAGNDNLDGGAGGDQLFGGLGNDTITGDSNATNAGNDVLRGEDGEDTITDSFGTVADIDGGAGNDIVTIAATFTSGSIAGGADTDALLVTGNANLGLLSLSGFERLFTNGFAISATASQFESFDRIAHSAGNPGLDVDLHLVASGGPTTLDLAGELSDGGLRAATVTGSSDAETITAGDGNDTVHGADANDVLNGGLGDDALHGDAGDDQIFGGQGDDKITGDTGATDAGNDVLRGEGGNDTVSDEFGSVADIDGGAGNDTIVIGGSFASGAIAGGADIDVLEITGNVDLSVLSLSGIERLVTNGSLALATAAQFEAFDRIAYNAGDLTFDIDLQIVATGGATTLDLSDELNDGGPRGGTVTGSSDSETITTGDGDDKINGGDGNDILSGGRGDDTLNGDAGNDRMSGGEGKDTIDGGSGNDVLEGGEGSDLIFGGAGNDTITGDASATGAGDDVLRGEDGNDVISDRFGTAVDIDGGAGNDTITVSTTFLSGTVAGGANNDVLVADGNVNLALLSLTGIERLATFGNTVTATAAQFEAFDLISFHTLPSSSGVQLQLVATGGATIANLADELNDGGSPRNATITGSADAETITMGNGNDTINGGVGNDILDGSGGADTLNGGSGNDLLIGGVGNDFLDGGADNDTATYTGVTNSIIVFAFSTGSTVYGGAGGGTDWLTSVERIVGSDMFDIFYSDGSVDVHGGGGPGYLVMSGVSSATVHVGTTVQAIDNIYLTGGNDIIDVIDNEYTYIFGLGGDDTIVNGVAGGWAYGGAGNDTFTGTGAGADVFLGENGNDTIAAGDGADTVYAGTGNDIVNGGDGADILWGEAGDDNLTGGNNVAGSDFLIAQDGNDTLNFDSGLDIGYGGAGADRFVWTSRTQGADIVGDFYHAEGDTLRFDAAAFGVAAGLLLVDGATFRVGAHVQATAASASFLYDTASNILWFDADGTGAQQRQAITFLSNGGGGITASDIVFF